MDETLLCLLRDYETAKEVAKHIDRLNEEIVKIVDKYLSEVTKDKWNVIEASIDDSFMITKDTWVTNNDDWMACFAFEIDDNEDDYDYWLNHMLGHSKFPFKIVCSFSGLLRTDCCEKSEIIDATKELAVKLIANGFSESTTKGKKAYFFSRPIKFEKQKLIEAFENESPPDGISILGDIVDELDNYVPLIEDVVQKFRQ